MNIVESLALVIAEVSHDGKGQVKLQYTMVEVDMSARLQVS